MVFYFPLIQLGKYSVSSFIKLAKSAKRFSCSKHFEQNRVHDFDT